jgi:hydroxymethylpyrimidine/phosphomethylpyrimidine kinase
MKNRMPPAVMTFAATDPSSGAGLQADVLTFASIGCHPLSVVTGLTVQDTVGVQNMLIFDADWVDEQARTILEDMQVMAFKIGMMGSAENVSVIAEIVADYPDIPLIIDPVLASGRGDELAGDQVQAAMIDLLLPQATLITPNSLEARRLACFHEDAEEDIDVSLDEIGQRLLDIGTEFVLITGTHERTADVVNTLYDQEGLIKPYHCDRLNGSYHGSGCTLASAITACLAHGLSITEAIEEAQEYTWKTLSHGLSLGMGQSIPDRMFWARDEDDSNS